MEMPDLGLAIIPARAGSKRLPGKNSKLFNGLPLISWTIKAALECQLFSDVWVSTDSEELAEISRSFGAQTPFIRPASLASDTSTTEDVILHAIDFFYNQHGRYPPWLMVLQPTSPLRNSEHINSALELFKTQESSFLVSTMVLNQPLQWLLDPNGQLVLPQNKPFKPPYDYGMVPNGAIYIADTKSYIQNKTFYSKETIYFPMDIKESVDIDTMDDWKLALFYSQENNK